MLLYLGNTLSGVGHPLCLALHSFHSFLHNGPRTLGRWGLLHVSFSAGHSEVLYSLRTEQSEFSVLITIYCKKKKKFLWSGLKDECICGYNSNSLGDRLMLFGRIVVDSSLGPIYYKFMTPLTVPGTSSILWSGPAIQGESALLFPWFSCHCCTSRYIVLGQSFYSWLGSHLGKTDDNFSPAVACLAPQSTMKGTQ